MMRKDVYTLKNKKIPEIKGTVVHEDPGVGGIKLVYSVQSFFYKEFKLFGHKVPVPWPYKISKKKFVVLRPYKDCWDKHRHKLPKNYWGKQSHPLTAMWIELEYDYDSINESIPYYRKQILDHKLINHLKRFDEEFSFIIN